MNTPKRNSPLRIVSLIFIFFVSFCLKQSHALLEQCEDDNVKMEDENARLKHASNMLDEMFTNSCLDTELFDQIDPLGLEESSPEAQDMSMKSDALCTFEVDKQIEIDGESDAEEKMLEGLPMVYNISVNGDFERLKDEDTYLDFTSACDDANGKLCKMSFSMSMMFKMNFFGVELVVNFNVDTKNYPSCMAASCEEGEIEGYIEEFALAEILSSSEGLRRKLAIDIRDNRRKLQDEMGDNDMDTFTIFDFFGKGDGSDTDDSFDLNLCNKPDVDATDESAITCTIDITSTDSKCERESLIDTLGFKSSAPVASTNFAIAAITTVTAFYFL